MMEVENFLSSVVGLGHKIQKDVNHSMQKLTGGFVSCREVLADGKQTWKGSEM